MKTGVFFNDILKTREWPIIGNKFRNFPRVMEEVLVREDVFLFNTQPVSEELLLKVHEKGFVEDVKTRWYYEGASHTVGGCVEASEKIWMGEIDNALVFGVAAGHHAGPSSSWGGTYISCTGPAIRNLRDRFRIERFAILDTDSHHGDGTRAMFIGDRNVLHVCFCSYNGEEDEGTKVDVNVGWRISDSDYLEKVREEFIARARDFRPAMLFHNLGHDTGKGDYGDRGLSRDFFIDLARIVKECTREICGGRYLIITHGGAMREVAEHIFPRIIEVLTQ